MIILYLADILIKTNYSETINSKRIKLMSEDFKAGASLCKDQDDTNNFANKMIRPCRPNTLDIDTPVAPPEREEMAFAIQRLKYNKASDYDGLPGELFKTGVDELVS